MAERTYWDYAEDDRNYLKDTYEDGYKRPAMASMGQNICERYLKHIILEYSTPETADEEQNMERALRTHNLRNLEDYIQGSMGIEIPDDLSDSLTRINGYYFSTRYPGDDSFVATERDVDNAYKAVEDTREFVADICREIETRQTQEEEQEREDTQEGLPEPAISPEWDDYER